VGLLKPFAVEVSATCMSTVVGQEREVLWKLGGQGYVTDVFEA